MGDKSPKKEKRSRRSKKGKILGEESVTPRTNGKGAQARTRKTEARGSSKPSK